MQKQIRTREMKYRGFLSLAMAWLVGGQLAYAAGPSPQDLEHPPMPQGIVIEPLDKHPVPDLLKQEAKREIAEMNSKGSVDVPEEAVSYIERAASNATNAPKAGAADPGNPAFKPMYEVEPALAVLPAHLPGTKFDRGEILGAAPGGVKTDRGWTAVSRVFNMSQGKVLLEEIDYVAAGGGLVMIKEAINQDVNGHPAILRVKGSRSGKSVTELTWATDRKIYNLSMNKAAKGKALAEFLELAQSLQD